MYFTLLTEKRECCDGVCWCDRDSTVVRILPRHLRELTQPSEIRAAHETLVGTPALLANVTFLEILKQWPLFGAIQFEVSVSCSFAATYAERSVNFWHRLHGLLGTKQWSQQYGTVL